ncbi:Divalent-cation tolerance protein CutA [uncultured Gammaproteobacteria bacterium]
MDLCLIYITTASREEATAIGRTLVEERLAACVNIFERMTSIYRWQGAIEQAEEAVLIAKTRPELVEPLTKRARSLHSYTTPCIIELPVGRVNPDYRDWLLAETGPLWVT